MDTATAQHLREKAQQFEQKYGWTTELFLRKFEAGEIGDDHDFFVWYALAQGINDWQKHTDPTE